MSNTKKEENFDPSKVEKLSFKEILKKIGPGIILSGIVIGPGAITTAANLGASYGYSLMWIYLLVGFMGSVYVLTTYRLAMLTGMPTLHAIRKYYGKFAAGFTGFALFLTCVFFTMGNISGSGTGLNLIFGIDWKLGSIIMLAILAVCYSMKNVYSLIEKGITICIAAMIVAFYITLVGVGGPDWGEFGKGLVTIGNFPEGSIVAALGFLSTHAAITTGIYGTYLGKEKKWTKADLFNGSMKADAIAHVAVVILISIAIMLVGAIVLHPQGQAISAPAQLAGLLEPVFGRAAYIIMGIALLGAAFSSLMGNTQRGLVLLRAGFDKPTELTNPFIKYGCFIVLAICTVICFVFNGSPVQLILIANYATAIATPVAGAFVTLMLWRKDTEGGLKAPTALRICMTICYIVCLILTGFSLYDLILG